MADNTSKHPGGRPTEYKEEYCEKVIEYMTQGDSKTAVAARLGIAKDTLYEWAKIHKEFSDAIKEGLSLSQLFWEDLGKELVLQGQGNATAWIFNMKNRFREEWSDTVKQELTGKDGGPIPILGGITQKESEKEI